MLAPSIPTLRRDGYPIPAEFNAKTKLVPDWSTIKDQIESDMKKIEEDARRRIGDEKGGKGRGSTLGAGLDWNVVRKVYDEMVDECGGGVRESMMMTFKARTEGFVVAPVDKYTQEMAIM